MPTKVIMPQLGESVVEGTITRWLKSVGETVEEYEPLLEVNTDKVDSEIPSPASGTLLKVIIEEGTTVTAGTLLALIGQPGEENGDQAAGADTAVEQKQTQPTPQPVQAEEEEPAQAAAAAQPAPTPAPAVGRDRDLGFISPVVSKIAQEHQVNLMDVPGTGLGGRITKKDIMNYVDQREEQAGAAPAPAPTPPVEARPAAAKAAREEPPASLPGELLPLTPVRKAIADHMVFSKRTSPHVTTVMEADLSKVVRHRQANKQSFSQDGVNLTFTAYFVSAITAALKAYPLVNSSWTDDGILLHKGVHIGMATSLGEAGLIVPVIKNADEYSLLGLAKTINDLADRARSRQLKPDEVKGGTFTITNHGTSGSLFATPIINQPQCGILGVGMVQKRVVVIDDAIAIRPMVYLSFTFDHRILDGTTADNFLAKVVQTLQSWNGS